MINIQVLPRALYFFSSNIKVKMANILHLILICYNKARFLSAAAKANQGPPARAPSKPAERAKSCRPRRERVGAPISEAMQQSIQRARGTRQRRQAGGAPPLPPPLSPSGRSKQANERASERPAKDSGDDTDDTFGQRHHHQQHTSRMTQRAT